MLVIALFSAIASITTPDSASTARPSRSQSAPSPSRTVSGVPEWTVSARSLFNSHEENAANFQSVYGNDRIMGVTGIVESVSEFGGDYIVSLYGSDEDRSYDSVDCHFDSSHETKLRKLRKGTHVSIVGQCDAGISGPVLRYCRLNN